MKKKLFFTILPFVCFVLWTIGVSIIDVRLIGPNQSKVGFATINGALHDFLGVNMLLYVITDWLGLVPVGCVMLFAVLGLIQWVTRKSIFKVDRSILTLGIFYIAVFGLYLLFESLVINYGPVLIDGYLEASYPSSTTLLTICVMPTVVMQTNARINNRLCKRLASVIICCFMAFMVISRLVSGVHWVTDIIGGTIISVGLLAIYYSVSGLNSESK